MGTPLLLSQPTIGLLTNNNVTSTTHTLSSPGNGRVIVINHITGTANGGTTNWFQCKITSPGVTYFWHRVLGTAGNERQFHFNWPGGCPTTPNTSIDITMDSGDGTTQTWVETATVETSQS